MTVYVDAHEKGGMEALVAAAVEGDVEPLDDFGGDYVAGGYLIERKRWKEVFGRMLETDTSFYYQVEQKLVPAAEALGLEPAVLLEGELGSPHEYSKVSPERVARYLAGLPVLGVTVIASTGRRCTARILARLESGEEPDPRRVRGTARNRGVEPRFVLEGFPGVGPSTAEALLDEFGDIASVMAAGPEELQRAAGVGPSTAETIDEVRTRGH